MEESSVLPLSISVQEFMLVVAFIDLALEHLAFPNLALELHLA
jgi:hypothetical protein